MTKRFAELDGLRIVAAMLVLMSHLVESPTSGVPGPIGMLFDGGVAVLIFFVLSGFVITRLLARELDRTGTIAMGQFYLRRALRIWPASYCYIAVAVIFIALHRARAPTIQIVFAATHLWNYAQAFRFSDIPGQGLTIFGHFWSLALEEQFYWAWPIAFLVFRRHIDRVLVAIILAMPLIRIASYVLFPQQRGSLNMMFQTGLDPMALGALLALTEDRLKPRIEKLPSWLFYANLGFLFLVCPLLDVKVRGFWTITYGRTLETASAGLLIFALAYGPQTRLAQVLRTAPFQFGGRISYGLYLWQQLFSLPPSILPEPPLVALALSLIVATASHYLIERPFLRLKDHISARGNQPALT